MKIRSLLILLLSMWIAPLILAQQTPQSLADAELPSLLGIYKDIHSHPELSGQEERTAGLVAKELRAAGCQVTEHLGKYENSNRACAHGHRCVACRRRDWFAVRQQGRRQKR
jgi:hypothetical protein